MQETQNASESKKSEKSEKHKSDKAEKAEKTEVKFDSMMPLEEAVSYFEAIVAGMKKGTISFKQNEQTLKLTPPAHLSVQVRAGKKKGTERVSFELEWQTSGASDLTISAE